MLRIITINIFLLTACSAKPFAHIPVTPNVSFNRDIKPIVLVSCQKCHFVEHRDYSKYNNAYNMRYNIKQKVVLEKSMPMGELLSDEARSLFRDWVDQGSKP